MDGRDDFAELTALVDPRSIVIVGASEKPSAGFRAARNILDYSTFDGRLYFVNPLESSVFGHSCWPSIDALPEDGIDVALLLVPAEEVPLAVRACVARKVRFVIIWSPGFAETDNQGIEVEQSLRSAIAGNTRLYGPNSPGVSNLRLPLGLTPSAVFSNTRLPGPIGLVSQGGGLGRCFIESMARQVGTSVWLSAGNEVDLEISDFIAHLAHDQDITAIAAIIEGVRDGPRFLRALQTARAAGKPVIILKMGRSQGGIQAARSHTAAMAGMAAVNSAIFEQFGAVEVDDIDELIDTSALLARRKAPVSGGVFVFSFSGGTNGLCADRIAEDGLFLTQLRDETIAALRALLPRYAVVANPIDLSAEILSRPELVSACLRLVLDDPATDTLLAPIPMEYGEVTATLAAGLVEAQRSTQKLVVPVWMTDMPGEGLRILETGKLLPFRSVGKATKAISRLARFDAPRTHGDAGRTKCVADVHGLAHPPKGVLNEVEAKAFLRRYGIGSPDGRLARSRDEAVAIAASLAAPVAVKAASRAIAHKTDIGGVVLDVRTQEQLESAFDRVVDAVGGLGKVDGILIERMAPAGRLEVIVGVHRDSTFGPILTFGLGGIFVELLGDTVHRLLPIDRAEALRMLKAIRGARLLEGLRGSPGRDIDALCDMLVRLSDLVADCGDCVREIDLNPVWVGAQGEGVMALDALLVFAD